MNSAILPVVLSVLEKWEFVGTCTFISQDSALTCAHLFDSYFPVSPKRIAVHSPSAGLLHPHDIHCSTASDLCLLSFEPFTGVTPAPLFRATQLKNRRLAGCGYTNEQNGLRQQSVPNVECIQDLLTGNYVQTVQLMGGIPHGFSGGPLQVCDGPYRYTAGILQLGGQGITTSQAIATDAIASFLIEAGWDGIIQDLPPATDAPTRPGLNDSAATVFNTTIGSISGGITNITNSVRSKT